MSLEELSADKLKFSQEQRMTPQEFLRTIWKFEDAMEPLPMGLDSSGSKCIKVGRHLDFPTNQIFLVDLSPFDNVFLASNRKV